MSEIESRVREIISDVIKNKVQPQDIAGENLIEELGITSVDALELLINVENAFDITIEDEDLSQELVSSIANIVGYIEQKQHA